VSGISSGVLSGIIGGVIAAAFLRWTSSRRRPVAPDSEGWSSIRPGAYLLQAAILPAVFVVFLLFVGIFFGIDENAGKNQLFWYFVLIISFSGASIGMAYYCFSRSIRWRGDDIVIEKRFADRQERKFSEIKSIRDRKVAQVKEYIFQDGYKLKISDIFLGTEQFLAAAKFAAGEDGRNSPAQAGAPRAER